MATSPSQDGGTWEARLSSPESVTGLLQIQDLMTEGLRRTEGRRQRGAVDPVLRGQRRIQFSAPNWVMGPRERRARTEDPDPAAPFVYALPGKDGDAAQVFAGGSNIGISRRSRPTPRLAEKALEIILSDEFQTIYGENGLIPAKKSLASTLGGHPEAQACTGLPRTRSSPRVAELGRGRGSRILEDFFVKIAQGGDVQSLAEEVDAKIEEILNS